MNIKDGKLVLSNAIVTYDKNFDRGDLRFYASGDFSVNIGNYGLVFASSKVGLTKDGKIIANVFYHNRETNFIKLEKANGFGVCVNGEKAISVDEKPSGKLQIESRNLKLDCVAHFK